MELNLESDLLELESLLELAKEQSIAYLNHLSERATSVQFNAPATTLLGDSGLGTRAALELFKARFEPSIVASSGPRYWGFVTGGTTPASIVGDWLSSVYDQNTQTVKGQGDISANIEMEAISLFADLLGLPESFSGGFVTGATLSNFTCLGVARQWVGSALGKNFAQDGVSEKIEILTATAHSSALKSLSMLGMGSRNFRIVKTIQGNREAIDLQDLEAQIQALKGLPFILISSAGTVNTVDFDDNLGISKLKEKYKFWWHIDAAFGGFAACSDKYKHLVTGWEQADSITVDCHKWLNVPYESAVYFVKKIHQKLQIETFQNSNAPYLGDPKDNFNYLNFLPENSRRLKALPTWFTLMAYGKEGYQYIVENSVNLAQHLSNYVENSEEFELLAPTRLNNVCFSLRGELNQTKVQTFLTALNATGKVFMTPTVYGGRKGIRAAFVNWRTQKNDVDLVFELMKTIFKEI
jgi:glutamate/tyrosine decarboxylase-like PLP-dependent enzyme